jgi:hypothetical protein
MHIEGWQRLVSVALIGTDLDTIAVVPAIVPRHRLHLAPIEREWVGG